MLLFVVCTICSILEGFFFFFFFVQENDKFESIKRIGETICSDGEVAALSVLLFETRVRLFKISPRIPSYCFV